MCYEQNGNKESNPNSKKPLIIPQELFNKICTFLPPDFIFENFMYKRFYNYLKNSVEFWNKCIFTENLDIEECEKIIYDQYNFQKQVRETNPQTTATVMLTYQSDMTHMIIHNDLIFTSSDDGTIRAFNFFGKFVSEFSGHSGGVWALYAIDNILVTGSTDKTARVWSIKDQILLTTLKYHKSTVRVLKCIDKYIITGGRDGKIVVWIQEKEECNKNTISSKKKSKVDNTWVFGSYTLFHILEGHTNSIRCMDVSDKYLVTGSYDCTVKLWDYRKGKFLKNIITHKNKIYAVKINKDWVASSGMNPEVCITSITNYNVIKHNYHTGMVVWLDFYGPYLISSGSDGSVIVYNYIKQKIKYIIQETSMIKAQKIAKGLLLIGTSTNVKLYNIFTGEFIKTLQSKHNIHKIEFCDNKIIVGYSNNDICKIKIFDYKNLTEN